MTATLTLATRDRWHVRDVQRRLTPDVPEHKGGLLEQEEAAPQTEAFWNRPVSESERLIEMNKINRKFWSNK